MDHNTTLLRAGGNRGKMQYLHFKVRKLPIRDV
jgi:hypothetical protein